MSKSNKKPGGNNKSKRQWRADASTIIQDRPKSNTTATSSPSVSVAADTRESSIKSYSNNSTNKGGRFPSNSMKRSSSASADTEDGNPIPKRLRTDEERKASRVHSAPYHNKDGVDKEKRSYSGEARKAPYHARGETDGALSNDPNVRLYDALRAARSIISTLDTKVYLSRLPAAVTTLLQVASCSLSVKAGGIDWTDCQAAFESLRNFHMQNVISKANIATLVILMDDCYFTLYYTVELHSRTSFSHSSPSSRHPIPSPHTYFSSGILGSKEQGNHMNSCFEAFLRRNFSADGLAKLQRVWNGEMTISGSSNTSTRQQPGQTGYKNPLLQLHYCRWRKSCCLLSLLDMMPTESNVLALIKSCKPLVLAASVPATMKGHDPLLPDITRKWNDSCRIWPCRLYAFATPSAEAIQKLCDLAPLVEIGAGTGYWTHMIRSHSPSAVVHAFDKDPPVPHSKVKANEYHGRSKVWTAVLKGAPEVSAQYKDETLFLCYPPPDAPMAFLALRAFTGERVCYVGEWQGDTGTKAFDKLLCENFTCEEIIPLPNWGDTCYMMMIWRRRLPSNSSTTTGNVLLKGHTTFPLLCSHCGNRPAANAASGSEGHATSALTARQLYRCKLTCNVYFCDEVCAAAGRKLHQEELSSKYLLQADMVIGQSDVAENGKPLIELSSSNFVKVQSPRHLKSDV